MKKPCSKCPFRKTVKPGYTGGSHASRFIGQAHGPFILPCHAAAGYDPDAPPEELLAMVPCEGARSFRANCKIPHGERFDSYFGEPSAEVFGSEAELLAHHDRIPLPLAQLMLTVVTPAALSRAEATGPKARITAIPVQQKA